MNVTRSALGVLAGGAFALFTATVARAQEAVPALPFLHPLFTDHAVLQRDLPLPIWGWTGPGESVTVALAGEQATATAGVDGRWLVKLGPFEAGGPHTLTVQGPQKVEVTDILMGDVWICSGQSNMQWGMWGVVNSEEEIAAADFPNMRLFTVPTVTAFEPRQTVTSQWHVCTPQSVSGFSAVGYFFGRHLHRELGVPIGLINTSWGGTIAEAWTSAEALKTMPDFEKPLEDVAAFVESIRNGSYSFDKEMAAWWAANDPGSKGDWAAVATDTSAWKTMAVPGNWESAGLADFDGIAWFRREFEAPAAWAGKEVTLHLGPIDDRDTTWVNGVEVGALSNWQEARDYTVPAGVIKAGRNVVAVRVLDTGGGGGFHGKAEDMKVELAATGAVALSGDWLYRVGAALADTTPAPTRLDAGNPNTVTVLYNAMIAPLLPGAIKGAIWYQGESNAGAAEQYSRLLPTMIRDWRSRFGVGDFPFLIVQLANFLAVDDVPKDDPWPHLRDAQLYTVETVPNTGLACTIDIGAADDIHPRNKQDVGLRLALAALGTTYGKDVETSGPVYTSMTLEGNKVRLAFDHLGGGLVVQGGGELKGFAIAGADKRFVWAHAEIDGDTVVVSSPEIANPTAVRYAWSNNPVCNLRNKADLPAGPFRTDR